MSKTDAPFELVVTPRTDSPYNTYEVRVPTGDSKRPYRVLRRQISRPDDIEMQGWASSGRSCNMEGFTPIFNHRPPLMGKMSIKNLI